jgi:hypothetical protein
MVGLRGQVVVEECLIGIFLKELLEVNGREK